MAARKAVRRRREDIEEAKSRDRPRTQYKHIFSHPQNPEIRASKGSRPLPPPVSACYRPSTLPPAAAHRETGAAPTWRVF